MLVCVQAGVTPNYTSALADFNANRGKDACWREALAGGHRGRGFFSTMAAIAGVDGPSTLTACATARHQHYSVKGYHELLSRLGGMRGLRCERSHEWMGVASCMTKGKQFFTCVFYNKH